MRGSKVARDNAAVDLARITEKCDAPRQRSTREREEHAENLMPVPGYRYTVGRKIKSGFVNDFFGGAHSESGDEISNRARKNARITRKQEP